MRASRPQSDKPINMYTLTCLIQFYTSQGRIDFDSAASVHIRKDADQLCDTCQITLPRRVNWLNIEANPISRGDRVVVSLGYNGQNQTAFVGYVRTVQPNAPTVVECACPMCLTQQMPAKRLAYSNTTLNQVLTDQGLQAEITGSQAIGAFRIESHTVAQLLDSLKQQGFRFMYRLGAGSEPRLYAGIMIDPADRRQFQFEEGRNIVSRDNLKLAHPDTLRFRVVVKSVGHTAQGRQVELGDADGELRTFNVADMSEAEMKDYGQQQLQRLKQATLSGSFTAFGGQLVDKLDRLQLRLPESQPLDCIAQKIEIEWGVNGFRQTITI